MTKIQRQCVEWVEQYGGWMPLQELQRKFYPQTIQSVIDNGWIRCENEYVASLEEADIPPDNSGIELDRLMTQSVGRRLMDAARMMDYNW